jgi:predicted RNA-binding protein with PUA-like domain
MASVVIVVMSHYVGDPVVAVVDIDDVVVVVHYENYFVVSLTGLNSMLTRKICNYLKVGDHLHYYYFSIQMMMMIVGVIVGVVVAVVDDAATNDDERYHHTNGNYHSFLTV